MHRRRQEQRCQEGGEIQRAVVGVDDEAGRQSRPSQDQRHEVEHRPSVLDGGRHVDDGRAGQGVVPRGGRLHLEPDARVGGDHDDNTNDDDHNGDDHDDAQPEHRRHADIEPDYTHAHAHAHAEPEPDYAHADSASPAAEESSV